MFRSLQRLHASLATLFRLCPKGRHEIFGVISSNSPFRLKRKEEIEWYYQQSLSVLRYVPEIESAVLELIVQKCLELDVEIRISDQGEVSIEVDEIFDLEVDEPATQNNSTPPDASVDDTAEKLDILMMMLLSYLDSNLQRDPTQAKILYASLIRVFEGSILQTHKSKFTQFLIMYLCGVEVRQLEASSVNVGDEMTLYRDFAARLIGFIVDPYRATTTRQAGTCYLASFVSRSSYVCHETTCEAVCALLRWADVYLQSPSAGRSLASNSQEQAVLHALFYTVCQAAFYIMCFRGVEAINYYREEKQKGALDLDHINIDAVKWTQICGHPLQPLRFCLESVRTEFLEVSRYFGLIEESVLERLQDEERQLATTKQRKKTANRIATPAMLEKERRTGGVGGLGQGSNPLDSFFPFDPYLLRRSHVFIDPLYRHWTGSIDAMLDDSDDESDEDEAVIVPDDREDEDDESDEDDGSADRRTVTFQPMSMASNLASYSSRSTVALSPDVTTIHRETQRQAWSETLKRTRAPSMENGSW